jgi:hypothetical protein
MQEPQPLGCQLRDKKIDTGRDAAGFGETSDNTKLDPVLTHAEDNGNGRCFGFGRDRGHVPGRGDQGHLSADLRTGFVVF